MSEQTITPAEACAVAGVNPNTLRAWHARLDFLPREGTGWRKYTFAELVAIRVVALLTERGLAAEDAIRITQSLDEEINSTAYGSGHWVGVSRRVDGNGYEWKRLDSFDRVLDAIGWFQDEHVHVFDLNLISNRLFFALRSIRGLDDV